MSMESAKMFVERMKTDEDFRKKVTECKDAVSRKALVVKNGFNFTVEDLKGCGHELTDDVLSAVTDEVEHIPFCAYFCTFEGASI